MIQGYDVSSYQGVIPQAVFDRLQSQGWFCMIRANEGTPNNAQVLNIDPQFSYNLNCARTAGVLRGVYHFSYPTLNSALSEADYFLSIYSPQVGEIMALDFETPIGGSSPTQENVVWAKTWLDTVASKTNGTKPLIYMDLNLCNTLDWSLVSDAGYGLWLADWTGNPNQLGKANNWSFIAMSQFSDQALVPEINGRVDQDAFYGDGAQFLKYGYTAPSVETSPTSTTTTPTDADTSQVEADQVLIANLRAQIVQLTNTNNGLSSQVTQLTTTSNAYKSELEDVTVELSQANIKINELETNLKELSSTIPTPTQSDNISVWSRIVNFVKGVFFL